MFVSIVILKKDNEFVKTKSIKIDTTNYDFAHKKWNDYLKNLRKEGFDCDSNILINVDKAEEVSFNDEELNEFLEIQEKYFNN